MDPAAGGGVGVSRPTRGSRSVARAGDAGRLAQRDDGAAAPVAPRRTRWAPECGSLVAAETGRPAVEHDSAPEPSGGGDHGRGRRDAPPPRPSRRGAGTGSTPSRGRDAAAFAPGVRGSTRPEQPRAGRRRGRRGHRAGGGLGCLRARREGRDRGRGRGWRFARAVGYRAGGGERRRWLPGGFGRGERRERSGGGGGRGLSRDPRSRSLRGARRVRPFEVSARGAGSVDARDVAGELAVASGSQAAYRSPATLSARAQVRRPRQLKRVPPAGVGPVRLACGPRTRPASATLSRSVVAREREAFVHTVMASPARVAEEGRVSAAAAGGRLVLSDAAGPVPRSCSRRIRAEIGAPAWGTALAPSGETALTTLGPPVVL